MIDREGFRPNVGIVLVNDQNQVFWARRVGHDGWQFPQGGVSDGETPTAAMYRELQEETGYRAGTMQRLLLAASSPGMANEKIHIFRAHDLSRVGDGGGIGGENITVHAVPRQQLPQWLIAQQARGAVIDSRVYAALTLAALSADEVPGW